MAEFEQHEGLFEMESLDRLVGNLLERVRIVWRCREGHYDHRLAFHRDVCEVGDPLSLRHADDTAQLGDLARLSVDIACMRRFPRRKDRLQLGCVLGDGILESDVLRRLDHDDI